MPWWGPVSVTWTGWITVEGIWRNRLIAAITAEFGIFGYFCTIFNGSVLVFDI